MEAIYILEDGKIRQKITSDEYLTFADVAKMTDDEVIEAFDLDCTFEVGVSPDVYKPKALGDTVSHPGRHPLYNSKYLVVGKTDNSGKIMEEEKIYFLTAIMSNSNLAIEKIEEGHNKSASKIEFEQSDDKYEIYDSEYLVMEHGSDAPYGGSLSYDKYQSDSFCIRTTGETILFDNVDSVDIDLKDEEIAKKLEEMNNL